VATIEAFGFEGFDFSASASAELESTFGDLFGDVLREQAARSVRDGPVRGADLHHTMTLAFEEAMRGGPRTLTATRLVPCRVCRGVGRLSTAEASCGACHGAGAVKSMRGHMLFSKPCPVCRGTGRQTDTSCQACGGQQTERWTETVTVNMPAGLADGAQVRLAGKGHAGRLGGEPGDLLLTVRVEPHPVFQRDGDDLVVVLPIAIHEAALGARLDVPALDGHARLRVPPGTQSGQRFRLRERGAPSVHTGRRGDLVVEVRLVLPRVLDERSKELLREFGRLNDDDVRQATTERADKVRDR
jgi:molecular chaperone DnaJ